MKENGSEVLIVVKKKTIEEKDKEGNWDVELVVAREKKS